MRLILLLLTVLAIAGCDTQKPEQRQGAGDEATESAFTKGVDRSHKGKAAPDTGIFDPDNVPGALAELKGKPVLVNLWASWCVPCVKELPTLIALSKRAEAPTVIAVSQDIGPRSSVDAWLTSKGFEELEVWHDPKMALSGSLGVQVLPTTILYGADGKEVWRYTGDLDWSGAEASELLAELQAVADQAR